MSWVDSHSRTCEALVDSLALVATLLVVGCWLLVVATLLVVGCWVVWLLVTGCWLLVVGYWLLVVGLLVVGGLTADFVIVGGLFHFVVGRGVTAFVVYYSCRCCWIDALCLFVVGWLLLVLTNVVTTDERDDECSAGSFDGVVFR